MYFDGTKVSDIRKESEKIRNMLDWSGEFSGSTCTQAVGPVITLETIQKVMEEFRGPSIRVWRGDPTMRLLQKDRLRPQLQADKNILDRERFYIVAGFGVVGHPDMIERLTAIDVTLEWSNEPQVYAI